MTWRDVCAVAALLAVIAASRCGSGSPTTPTSGAIASVALTGASVSAGSTMQGTLTLAAAASAATTVALTSSNTAVATVQTPITVPAGLMTAPFTVTGVSSGTAAITATLNGSSRQSATFTVSPGAQLSSITLSTATVVGGSNVTATAMLSGPAPAGGATVTLSSADPVTLPSSVTVAAGATSVDFIILTQVVGATTNATIRGSYGGSSASAVLSLTRPTLATANFGVSGPQVTESCAVINGGTALDCTFNGSTSSAPGTIVAWDWTYGLTTMKAQTTKEPILSTPAFNCSMLPPPPLPASGSLTMMVTLKIHDDAGNVSALAADNGVRLLPQGSCGY